MKKLITILFAFMYLCSCTWSKVYYRFPNPPAVPNIEASERPDVTFSIDWGVCWKSAQTCWIKEDWQQRFAEIIRRRLAGSGMFRSVRQTTFANRSDYHFDFEVNFDNPETMSAIDYFTGSMLASGLLFWIPPMVTQEVKVDFTMRLFADSREAYALAVPADSNTTFSLLQIPLFFLVALAHTSPDKTFDKAMDYFIGCMVYDKMYDKKLVLEKLDKEKQAQASAQPADNAAEQIDNGVKPYTPNVPAILDKDEYVKKAKEILQKGPVDGTIELPKLGVLFKISSSELLPYYNEMLDSFIELYKQTDGTVRVNLVGYSSNGGHETGKNPELFLQRAFSVGDYLKKHGVEKLSYVVSRHLKDPKPGDEKDSFFHAEFNHNVVLDLDHKDYAELLKSKGCKGGQCLRRAELSVEIDSIADAYYEKKDYANALKQYLKDYENGFAVENKIGNMYLDGEGTEKDYSEALRWFTISAEKWNYAGAYNNIGHMYVNGLGVKTDYAKAMNFFEKGWKGGNSDSAANIGVLYEKGYGVEKNISKAKEWYQKAADAGNAFGKKALERLSGGGQ